MKQRISVLRDALLSLGIISAAFLLSTLLVSLLQDTSLVPMVFFLAVFLAALLTHGYFYGIAASLVSVAAVNYAFTFPYFEFNLSAPRYFLPAVFMFPITFLTSALTTKIKYQDKMKVESEKEKMRANLLRAISHDLRTPLTSIYGASSAIMENYSSLTPEQHLKLLGEIREDSEWLIRMVENLLSITRISEEGAGVRIAKTPVVLEELVDGTLAKFRKCWPAVPVEIDIPEEFIRISMDAILIQQVLINLFTNAAQHARGMTKIEFRVFIHGDHAIFEVADDGCGIRAELLPHLFSGYLEKENGPVDKQKRGMGIGLSVCATIIKAHGGIITANNRSGGGALFHFTIPVEADPDE